MGMGVWSCSDSGLCLGLADDGGGEWRRWRVELAEISFKIKLIFFLEVVTLTANVAMEPQNSELAKL